MAKMGYFNAVTVIPDLSIIIGSLSYFAGSLRSLHDPLERAVDEVIRPRIVENFESESDAGFKWDDLAPVTVARRGSAHPILNHTGALRKVATSKKIWQINGLEGTAYVTSLPGVEYGFYHDTGSELMPRRRFISITEEDMDKIEEIFEEFLQDRINAVTAGGIAVRSVLGR